MKRVLRSGTLAALLALVMALLSQVAAVFSASPVSRNVPVDAHIPGEVLVKFGPARSATHRHSAVASQGHAVLADLNRAGWMQVKLAPGQTIAEAVARYQSDPDVEHVQPNYVYRKAAVPNDPHYGQLWALKNNGQAIFTATYFPSAGTAGADLNIESAWDHVTDCSSAVVAVIDTGVNYNQEDLASNMWNGGPAFPRHGTDFVDNDNDPMDLDGHGTHVAGTIGATGNNGTGSTGACWRASIMAVRVLDATGAGTTAGLIQGINFAVSHGAKVINMSLGRVGGFDQATSDAISNAQANGVVVVTAAGNNARNNDLPGAATYPCNFAHPNLVCVAALDQNYALASFSNFGAGSVDVGAPGTNILSTGAGARSSLTDDFHAGGVLDWTSSGGWAYRQLTLSGSPVDVLVNPATFPSGTYSDNADHRVHRTFNLPGGNASILSFAIQHAIQPPGDVLNVNYRSGGGDPFAGGVFLDGFAGTSGGVIGPFSYDISACAGGACAVGFRLLTDASFTNQGAGILFFSIDTLSLNSVTYETLNGTSMATPQVAGLAAMLRAYNPQYTYSDVVNAIKNGGRPIGALAGRTTTGKATDFMSSLAYINAPGGLRATVAH